MFSWLFLLHLALAFDVGKSFVAPILDIENETVGYLGTIGERNVLVDLKPHLQIKNIDAINGICSYHVFKPNNEEFPFTIDIKDKITGEAVIEVVRKEIDQSSSGDSEDGNNKKIKVLDCKKRKDFKFFIQAHDCSSPSLPSNKVPVRVMILDHDDSPLKFEQHGGVYEKTLAKSNLIYENFMQVRARDEDCTNDGYACLYKLLSKDLVAIDGGSEYSFKIDSKTGNISSTRALRRGEQFNFYVRAFDCLNNQSFVDAQVNINVVEPCAPEWTNYPTEILSTLEATNVFDGIKMTSCEKSSVISNPDEECKIENVEATVSLNLEPKIAQENCQKKCIQKPAAPVQFVKSVIFNAEKNSVASQADDNIEDDEDPVVVNDDDELSNNKVVPAGLNSREVSSSAERSSKSQPADAAANTKTTTPSKYVTFSKVAQNAKLIPETPKFNEQFTLSAWLRRPPSADRNVKEHVLCGTDSKSMNRHHFGLYFYRGNIKFLLRREHQQQAKTSESSVSSSTIPSDSTDTFYPSLWEWQLPESLLTDSKWHFYEIKFAYPNASLYIDNVKFIETASNSDIIDAYELLDVVDVGSVTTYVGACYHARTQSLIDFFEGDIANLELNNVAKPDSGVNSQTPSNECQEVCSEVVEVNSAGVDSILSVERKNELKLKAKNLDDMIDLVKKTAYVNKETYPKQGLRSIQLSTLLKCTNGNSLKMKEAQVKIQVKSSSKKEFVVRINGEKQLFASKQDLENGIEPFKEIAIEKILVDAAPKIDSSSSSDEYTSGEEPADAMAPEIQLASCQVKISPERNLMTPPGVNNEKVMFLQNLLDEFGFKFAESADLVSISGVQSIQNYEAFLRRLTYVILNIGDVEPAKLNLVKNKKFWLSCVRADSNKESNSILVQVNLTQENSASSIAEAVAFRQAQKYVVADADDEGTRDQLSPLSFKNHKDSTSANPLVIALIVMVACAFGFILVFAAIKIHTSKILYNYKRKSMANEENPQMEWDDSGLNITENPLDTLETKKNSDMNVALDHDFDDDDDEFMSSDDEDEEDQESNLDEKEEEAEREDHVLYSSEEENNDETERATNLEWDDMNIDIVKRQKQQQQLQQQQQAHLASNKIDSNHHLNKFI